MKYCFFLFSLTAFIFITPLSANATSTNITYIGDSQSAASYGVFKHLKDQLKDQNINFNNTRAVCGATIDDYSTNARSGRCKFNGVTSLDNSQFKPGSGKTELIKDLISRDTDAVVVQLGDNHLGQSEEKIKAKAQQLAGQILAAGKKCIWIGPTSAPKKSCKSSDLKKKKTSEAIKKALQNYSVNGQKCKFIDSYNLAPRSKVSVSNDCLHYKNSGYKTWARSISGRLLTEINKSSSENITKPTFRPKNID